MARETGPQDIGIPAGWRDKASFCGQRAGRSGLAAGVTLAAVFGLAKGVQLGLAAQAGFLSQLSAWRWAGVAGMFAEDLLAAGLLGALVLGLAAAFAGRSDRVGPRLAVAWGVVLPVTLLSVVGVALYRLYQTPLTYGQIGLMGRLSDFRSSVAANLTPLNVALLLVLPALSVVSLPVLGRWALRRLTAWRGRPRVWVPGLVAALAWPALSYAVLPGHAFIGLELNPVIELARSALRSRSTTTERLELGHDPHFETDRVFDPTDPPEAPLASLVDPSVHPTRPMNLLLLVGESWAASQHCLLDGPPEACPRLQGLRQHSLLFDQYYSITPVSMKSLFSITCSLHPVPIPQAETYVHGNIDCRSISEILKDQGYATIGLHGGHFSYSDKLRYLEHRKYDVLRDGETLRTRKRYPLNGWGADDRAVRDDFFEWLGTLPPGSPWHALLLPVTPHYPYQPIRGLATPFGADGLRNRYLNQMVLQDQIVGDLWDELARRGELDRTLIVLVGDHGQAFEEHPGNTMHGSYLYEESIRVPLILLHPRLFHGGTSHRLGNHLDLVPTVLELLGLPPVPRHEGVSLLAGYRPHRVHTFTRYAHYQLGLRDGRYKFIHDKDRDSFELYDLSQDRGEQRNLASTNPEKIQRYRQLTDRWESFYQELIPHYETYRLPKQACSGKPSCFLDELEPTFTQGKAVRRKSALGGKLQLAGRVHGRGWGVEAPSILRFSVAGLDFSWLEGKVGHDDDIYAGQLGETVSAQIYVDEKLVFSSGKLKKGSDPVPFRLPLQGAGTVEFFGYDMDGIGYRDNIDWADLRLTR